MKLKNLGQKLMSKYEYFHNKEQLRQESMGFMGKMIDIIDFPFSYLRKLTINPGDDEEYDH